MENPGTGPETQNGKRAETAACASCCVLTEGDRIGIRINAKSRQSRIVIFYFVASSGLCNFFTYSQLGTVRCRTAPRRPRAHRHEIETRETPSQLTSTSTDRHQSSISHIINNQESTNCLSFIPYCATIALSWCNWIISHTRTSLPHTPQSCNRPPSGVMSKVNNVYSRPKA